MSRIIDADHERERERELSTFQDLAQPKEPDVKVSRSCLAQVAIDLSGLPKLKVLHVSHHRR
jgi:hypothetical protein